MHESRLESARTPRLADRLNAARHRSFVGRSPELALFRSALTAPALPFAVLFIYGPGGVGKTTLLREYSYIAAEAGACTVLLDARNLDPSPQGFLLALRFALGLAEHDSPVDVFARQQRSVLLIDTYETVAPLDPWLREVFLPQLPESTLVVIAGRVPPGAAWCADLEWRELVQVLPLRNLRPDESQAYLATRGVPPAQHDAVLAFTHGHPLALSLVGDLLSQRNTTVAFRPEDAPDLVRMLLQRFIEHVPSIKHRAALELCAHVRVTTEALLREALAEEDIYDIFEWLRSLTFIEQGPFGLFPHDLAREAIDSDFRWRDPETYRAVHERVRAYYVRKLQETRGLKRQRVFFDIMYLHRQSPIMRAYVDFKALGSVYAEPARPEEHAAILAMVASHEGPESARIARYWLAHQPEAFIVVHGAHREVLGFGAELELQQATPEDLAADPGAQAAWAYAQRQAPLRPGDTMRLARFLVDRQTYQQPSPVITLIQIMSTIHWLTIPNMAWSFVSSYADPEFWRPIMRYINYQRVPEADFEVGGRRYGAFAHDFRVVNAAAWLEITGARELETDLTLEEIEAHQHPPQLLVLSQPEFADAVRLALRDYHRPAALAGNPLLRSRLIAEQSGAEPGPARLQALLREAAEALRATPRGQKLYRALWHTYFEPAATQELAAELLDLPFSTYRYHLTGATRQVIEWLWQRELYGFEH